MAIALSTRFTRHSWAMPPIPGFPSGVWSASADDEGDASGGEITFQHIFRNTSNNLGDTNLYNIEHVMCTSQFSSATAARIRINGMDPGTGQPATTRPVDRVYTLPMVLNDSSAGFVISSEARAGTIPIWVGTFDGPDTDLGDVIIAMDNADSLRYIVVMYGYYWAPGAINAEGGIQRPPNGLWRS